MEWYQSKNINTGLIDTGGGEVRIGDNFYKSLEYTELQERIEELQDLLQAVDDPAKQKKYALRLEQEQQKMSKLKQEVIELAATFQQLHIVSDRLQRARTHFDRGEYREARAVLDAAEMEDELGQLLDRQATLAAQQAENEAQLESKYQEFMILAQLAEIEGESSFAEIEAYYEQALRAQRKPAALHRLADYCLLHFRMDDAEKHYLELLSFYPKEKHPAQRTGVLQSLASIHLQRGNLDAAEAELEQAQDSLRFVQGHDKESRRADILVKQAQVYAERGDLSEAVKIGATNIDRIRSLYQKDQDKYARPLGYALLNLAEMHIVARQMDEAREALSEVESVLSDLPAESWRYYDLEMKLNQIRSKYFIQQGDLNRALEYEALVQGTLWAFSGLSSGWFSADLANSFFRMGLLQLDLGQAEPALKSLREAIRLYRELHAESPQAYQGPLARAHYRGAGAAAAAGELDLAKTWYLEASDLFADLAEVAPKPYGILQGKAFNDLATLHYQLGAYPDAEMLFSGATYTFRDLLERHDLPVVDELATVLFNWGNALREQEKWIEALRHYQESLHFHEQLLREAPEELSRQADLAFNLIECADCIKSGESVPVAESYFQEAVQRFLKLANADPDSYLLPFGQACLRFGRFYRSVDKNQDLSVHYAKQAIMALLQLELDDDIRFFVQESLQLLRDWGIDDQAFLQELINDN